MSTQPKTLIRASESSLSLTLARRLDVAFEVTWLAGLIVVAFVFNGNNYLFHFTQPKQYAVHLIGLVLASLWILELALKWQPRTARQSAEDETHVSYWKRPVIWAGRDPLRWGLLFVALFTFGQIMSTIFSASPGISFFGRDANDPGYELYAIFGYMLMLVTVAVRIRTSDQVLRFLRTITAIGFLTSLYGFLQYLGIDPFGFGEELAFSGSRVYSTYGNPIFFASFVAMSSWLTLAWTMTEHHRRGKLWPLVAGVIFIAFQWAVIWLTGSRGPIFALVIGGLPATVIVAFFLYRRIDFGKVLGLLAAALAMSVVLTTFVPALISSLSDEPTSLSDEPTSGILGSGTNSRVVGTFSAGSLDVATSGRTEIWAGAFELLRTRENWPEEAGLVRGVRHIFGYGQDMYRRVYPLTAPGSTTFMPASHAHNFVLQIWLELGLWGLLSFIGLAVSVIWAMVLVVLRGRAFVLEKESGSLWLSAVVVGLWASLATRGAEQIPGVGRVSDLLLFWTLLGFVFAIERISSGRLSETVQQEENSSKRSVVPAGRKILRRAKRRARRSEPLSPAYQWKPFLTALALVFAVASLVIFISVDVRAIRGSALAVRAVHMFSDSDNDVRNQAVNTLRDAIDLDPRAEDFASRLVDQLVRLAQNQLRQYASTRDPEEKQGHLLQASEALRIADETIDRHQAHQPWSFRSGVWKTGILAEIINLEKLRVQEGHDGAEERLQRTREELEYHLRDIENYMSSFYNVLVNVATNYGTLGLDEDVIRVTTMIVESRNASNEVRAQASFFMGQAFVRLKMNEEARETFGEGIKYINRTGKNSDQIVEIKTSLHYELGRLLIRLGEEDEGVQHYTIAASFPNDFSAITLANNSLRTLHLRDAFNTLRDTLRSINPEGAFDSDYSVDLASAYNLLSDGGGFKNCKHQHGYRSYRRLTSTRS